MTTQTAMCELKTLKQWGVWCLEPTKDNRLTKVPYQARNGFKAASTNQEHWCSYDEAVKASRQKQNADGKSYNGIGFVFNDDFTGIDLDHCVNDDGSIDAWAQEILDSIQSYAEYSQSKTGIHLIVRALLPEVPNKETGELKRPGTKRKVPDAPHSEAAIEMYCQGRFFVMTGDHLEGVPTTIESRQKQLTELHQQVTATRKTKKDTPHKQPPLLTDDQLIDKARQAKNGAKFSALWDGSTEGYLSASEADQALCNMLAFWTGKDDVAIDRLFRRSGLYRDKWDRDDYRQETINKAIEQCNEAYSGWEKMNIGSANKSNGNGNGNGHQEHEKPTGPFNLTDLGNAERFAARYKDTVRWCETWNTWLVYNGQCWERDRAGRVDQLAKATVRSIYHEVANETDDAKRAQLAKHAKSSESSRAIRAMLDRAKSEMPAQPEDFNTQRELLNCKNGTLDLRTGELRKHSPDDMITYCLKYKYNSRAECPLWHSFMKQIFAHDDDLIEFVHQALGMSLSGNIKEQCWFICHGDGNNGKSTMLDTAGNILMPYSLTANIESFQVKKNDAPNYDQAEFYGKRLITASETQPGKRLNEAFMKKITGGDKLRAARKYESEFEFDPECTIWLSVNHKPVVKDTSRGMWRRVRFIPFTVTLDDNQVDTELPEKLMKEAEGILAWLIQGCKTWYSQGRLTVPQTVKDATQNYRNEQDTIARFLEDECVFNPKSKTLTSALNTRYELWCEQNNEKPDSHALKETLNRRNLHSKRSTGGKYAYEGLELKDGTPPTPDDPLESDGKSERSERSEPKESKVSREKNTNDNLGELSSLRSLRSLSEHEITENSDGMTQEIEDARAFYQHFCSQEGYHLRLQEDGVTFAIGVPEEVSDAEFEAIREQVDARSEALREVLREKLAV